MGLGGGRTPAGDDILVGVLAALDLVPGRHARASRQLLASLLAEQRSETTLVSAALLAAAAEGRYPEPIAELLRQVAAPRPDKAAIERDALVVGALGHSSGRAFLYGLRVGLG